MKVTLRSLALDHQVLQVPKGFRELTLGRGADCDLRVDGLLVSRHHCKLILRDDRLFVRDLCSTNGTAVNGEPVVGERLLEDGDQLMLAATAFEVGIRAGNSLALRLGLVSRAIARALRPQTIHTCSGAGQNGQNHGAGALGR